MSGSRPPSTSRSAKLAHLLSMPSSRLEEMSSSSTTIKLVCARCSNPKNSIPTPLVLCLTSLSLEPTSTASSFTPWNSPSSSKDGRKLKTLSARRFKRLLAPTTRNPCKNPRILVQMYQSRSTFNRASNSLRSVLCSRNRSRLSRALRLVTIIRKLMSEIG